MIEWVHGDEKEYERRRDARLAGLIERGMSFVYDASVDRSWSRLKQKLGEAGYAWFIVSMDLSKGFLTQLQSVKRYDESIKYLNKSIADHDTFVEHYGADISLHILDSTFRDRLELSDIALKQWLEGRF